MSDEAVGQPEPCDWCGRPGTVEQADFWSGDTLQCRNPALCDVCSTWWHLSGDEKEAIFDVSGLEMWVVMRPFAPELMRKWREKVANGTRSPQGPDDRSLIETSTQDFFSPEGSADA